MRCVRLLNGAKMIREEEEEEAKKGIVFVQGEGLLRTDTNYL